MRIWIAGAGGIGSVVGARLVGAPAVEVVFVDSWIDHVAAMNDTGLVVDYPQGTVRVQVSAVHLSEVATVAEPDVVLLCVKSFQTSDTVTAIRPFLREEAFVVSLQNGLNEETIAELIGSTRTVGAIALFDGALVEPGHASQVRGNPLVIGELDGRVTPRLKQLAEVLKVSVPITLSTNIWGELWSKLIRNLVLTTVGGVTGMGFGALVTDTKARRVGLRLGSEAVRIAQALKVDLVERELFDAKPAAFSSTFGSPEFQGLEEHFRSEYEHLPRLRSSMLVDLLKGRPTEIEYLSGYAVRKGRELGIPTPFNSLMLALGKELERGVGKPSPEHLDRFDSLLAS